MNVIPRCASRGDVGRLVKLCRAIQRRVTPAEVVGNDEDNVWNAVRSISGDRSRYDERNTVKQSFHRVIHKCLFRVRWPSKSVEKSSLSATALEGHRPEKVLMEVDRR